MHIMDNHKSKGDGSMTKYAPLKDHLINKGAEFIPMTFSQIEKILGFSLPPSKKYPAWWSNNSSNSVMTKVWLDAGYKTESVDISGEKLVFHREGSGGHDNKGDVSPDAKKTRRHPLFGCLAGLIHIPDDTDLTAPADPDWGKNL